MVLLLQDHLLAFINNSVQFWEDMWEGSWMFVNDHLQPAITGSYMVRHNVMNSKKCLSVCLFHKVHHMEEGNSLTSQGLIASLCISGHFSKETIFSNHAPIGNKILIYYL